MCAPIQRSFEAMAVRVREFRGGCGMELWDLDGLGRCTTDILLLVLSVSSYFHLFLGLWQIKRFERGVLPRPHSVSLSHAELHHRISYPLCDSS
jgi:hypothetical protein